MQESIFGQKFFIFFQSTASRAKNRLAETETETETDNNQNMQ